MGGGSRVRVRRVGKGPPGTGLVRLGPEALARLPRFVRRLALLLAPVLVALSVAGCGGGSSGSPLDEGLGFLPKDAPFVAAVDTDLEGSQFQNVDRILKRFPFGNQVKTGIRQSIQRDGVDFEKDVKPLLGNPFVIGAANPRAVTDRQNNDFIAAIKVKDEGKLGNLVDKEKAKGEGEKSGYKLYRDDDGDSFAVKDDVIVFGGSKGVVEDGIDQHGRDDSLDEDGFKEAVSDLPSDALFRASGDLKSLLESDPGSRQALRVPWVAALKDFGLAASVERDRISVDFKVSTDSGKLSDKDLPIASGDAAPSVVKHPGEINVGLRDPRQVYEFAQRAGQAANPGDYGQFQQAKRQISKKLGVSIDDDIVGQLSGDVSVNATVNGKIGVRAEVKDPAAFKRTLRKAAPVLPSLAKGIANGRTVGLAKPKKGQPFYALATPDGDSVVFGVVGKAFVLSNQPARAGRLTTEKPTSVSGAKGSVVVTADAEKVADRALSRLAPQIGLSGAFGGALFTGPLGDLTGSVSASTDDLRGNFTLGID